MSLFEIHIDQRQLRHLLIVFSDAVVPLWRIPAALFPAKRTVLQKLNPLALLLVVLGAVLLANLDEFPGPIGGGAELQFFKGTRAGGVRTWIIPLKLLVSGALLAAVVASFLLDLKDALSIDTLDRFVYWDTEHDPNRRLWWAVLILIFGYLGRLLLFGYAGQIGLYAANLNSIIKTGQPMLGPDAALVVEAGFRVRLLSSINNPLASWPVETSGNVMSDGFVAYLSLMRLLVVTFLISVFFSLAPKLNQSETQDEPIPTRKDSRNPSKQS